MLVLYYLATFTNLLNHGVLSFSTCVMSNGKSNSAKVLHTVLYYCEMLIYAQQLA